MLKHKIIIVKLVGNVTNNNDYKVITIYFASLISIILSRISNNYEIWLPDLAQTHNVDNVWVPNPEKT